MLNTSDVFILLSTASHLLEGCSGGGDGGDHSGAGEVLDGGVQEDGGHSQGGQHNQQPENLASRLYLGIKKINNDDNDKYVHETNDIFKIFFCFYMTTDGSFKQDFIFKSFLKF